MFDPGSSKKSMTWTRKSLAFMTSLPSFQRNWKWEKLLKSHLVKPTWKIASPINQKMVSICFNYSIQGSASYPPSLSRARNCLALSHLPAFHPNPPHCSCGGWGSPCGHLWSGRPGSGLSTRGCQQRKVCNYLLVSRCFVYWVEAERGLIILTFAILWIFPNVIFPNCRLGQWCGSQRRLLMLRERTTEPQQVDGVPPSL